MDKYQKGFTILTLGWSGGDGVIPVGFKILSSAKQTNRYHETSDIRLTTVPMADCICKEQSA